MREIKFRVWDKLNGQMLQVAKLDVLNSEVEFNYEDTLPFEEVELMQYTGLKDKNGKEIHEGDIVKLANKICEVVWTRGLACFEVKEINSKKLWIDALNHISAINSEVIGNIFENPELLEV